MRKFSNAPGRAIGAESWKKSHAERIQSLRGSGMVVPERGVEAGRLKLEQEVGSSRPETAEDPKMAESSPESLPAPPVPSTPSIPSQPEPVEPELPSEKLIPKPTAESVYEGAPLTEAEVRQGLKARMHSALRWLAEWVVRQVQLKKNPEVEVFEISLPKDNETEIGLAEQMYANLAGLGKSGGIWNTLVGIFPQLAKLTLNSPRALALEIVAEPELIRFLVVVPHEWAKYVEKQIHGTYSEAEIRPVPDYNIFDRQGYVAFAELRTGGAVYKPLRTYEDLANDPLNALTSAMSKLGEDEALALQILIQPAGKAWRQRGQAFVNAANKPPDPEKKGQSVQVDPKVAEAVSEKISKVGFKTALRVVSVAADKLSAESNLDNLVNAFDQFGRPGLSSFKKKRIWLEKGFMNDFLWRHFPRWGVPMVFNTEELATIYHLPNQDVQTPHIQWLLSKKSAAPQELPSQGLYLGISQFRGQEKKIFLPEDDRRRHTYIIGQTGTGKSEFLKFMAQQDIQAGRGLAFIDPHGDAVEDLLSMVPKERAEDVIYFSPGDRDRPMGLNILDVATEEGQHLIINSFINLLYKLYDPQHTGIIGPQLERAVRNVMLTAMSEPDNTMIEVLRLLTDPEFAKEKIPLVKDPLVKRYWTDELAQTTEFHKSEKLGYFVSKFDRFVTEKIMRNIIGQGQSAFDFREVMDSGKILLINLSKGLIGEEDSNFLGLILVPRLLTAAMSRVDQPEAERRDFYLYVDEFQNFSTPDFAQILAEARKYRLSLVVANQYIAQIEEKIRDAVFGNVGSKVSFRVGADDAAYLEKQFEPTFNEADLLNLSVGETVTRILVNGQPTTAFSMKTDWPAIQALPRDQERAGMIKQLSRLRYGRDREIVEAEIKQRAKL